MAVKSESVLASARLVELYLFETFGFPLRSGEFLPWTSPRTDRGRTLGRRWLRPLCQSLESVARMLCRSHNWLKVALLHELILKLPWWMIWYAQRSVTSREAKDAASTKPILAIEGLSNARAKVPTEREIEISLQINSHFSKNHSNRSICSRSMRSGSHICSSRSSSKAGSLAGSERISGIFATWYSCPTRISPLSASKVFCYFEIFTRAIKLAGYVTFLGDR